jgi:NADH-quinone oxidoreductase subunit J
MAAVLFFVAAAGVIAGAVGTVALRNSFYCVLALVGHLLSLAALFLLLRAEFVAAAQVVVYAGAVMVLYVFVVAYVGGTQVKLAPASGPGFKILGGLFAVALFAELSIAVLGSGLSAIDSRGANANPNAEFAFGGPAEIGRLLLTKFLLPFEVASFLLLIAAVGAVTLARRRGGLHEEEHRLTPRDVMRPIGTGTMAETVSGSTGTPAHRELGTDDRAPAGAGTRGGW